MTTRGGAQYQVDRSIPTAIDTSDGIRNGLRGPVHPTDYHSYKRLARIFGLGTKAQVKAYMNHKVFDGPFQELYTNWIQPQQANAKAAGKTRKRGPAIKAVLEAIRDERDSGQQRYDTMEEVDKSDFEEVDHYALCLVKLRHSNTHNVRGLFWKKTCNQEEIDVRLWQGILRATADKSSSRNNANRVSTDQQRYGPLPGTSIESGIRGEQTRVDSDEEMLDISDIDESAAGAGVEVPGQEQPDNPTANDPEVAFSDRIFEILKETMDKAEPMRLSTPYGQYLVIYLVLENYHQPLELQRLMSNKRAIVGEENNGNYLSEETLEWYKTVNASMNGKRVALQPVTDDQASAVSKMEKLLDNRHYQRLDYGGACTFLGITDPVRPFFNGMTPGIYLKSWQVTGISAMLEFKANGLPACLLADVTGLGKTYQIIGLWLYLYNQRQEKIAEYRDWDIAGRSNAGNPMPTPPGLAKPILLLVPASLIYQWVSAIKAFTQVFNVLVYYGDAKSNASSRNKISGFLDRNSKYFDGAEHNSRVIIVSSEATMSARHGPSALKSYRMKYKAYSEASSQAMYAELDTTWMGALCGLFEIVSIDEAHIIKNRDTAAAITTRWLKAEFYVMATAMPLPNAIRDCAGYIQHFAGATEMWTEKNLDAMAVTKTCNPYELPDTHPAAILRYSKHAVDKFIAGPDVDLKKAGFYLEKIWKAFMIRRTYASINPSNHDKLISDSLPKLYNRRIICNFTTLEQEVYNRLSSEPRKKLVKFLENGKVVWNRKYSRQLILLSTWTNFIHIEDQVTAKTVADWKSWDDMLYRWIKIVWKGEEKMYDTPTFELPKPDDVMGILSAVCSGSPKIRQTLRIIVELVLVAKRSVVVWCAMPANQLLLHGIMQLLCIPHATYTAELSLEARNDLVNQFTNNPDECKVFIASYAVGGVGLNLQKSSNHSIDFDAPGNRGEREQAIGRQRRIGQSTTIERFELHVPKSFHSRIVQNALAKAIPGALAELTADTLEVDDLSEDIESQFSVGKYYLIDGELVDSSDPRVDSLPPSRILTPEQLVQAIFEGQIKTENDHTWEGESLRDLATNSLTCNPISAD